MHITYIWTKRQRKKQLIKEKKYKESREAGKDIQASAVVVLTPLVLVLTSSSLVQRLFN